MVTSKDNYQFRKTHDARIPFGLNALKTRGNSLPDVAFRYGKANRPQTPVKGIIFNQYGENATQQLQSKYKDLKDYKKQFSPVNNKFDIKYTKAQMKHDEYIRTQSMFHLTGNQPQFKLKRFMNVEPKVTIVHPWKNRSSHSQRPKE